MEISYRLLTPKRAGLSSGILACGSFQTVSFLEKNEARFYLFLYIFVPLGWGLTIQLIGLNLCLLVSWLYNTHICVFKIDAGSKVTPVWV